MKTKRIASLVLLLVLTGCVKKVVTAPVRFLYYDKKEQKWAEHKQLPGNPHQQLNACDYMSCQ